jgi:heme-degrading monooxygenase HmoA
MQFALVRGKDDEDGTHRYASHTTWETRQAFVDWTQSEAFRKAHGQRSASGDLTLGHPVFKGWETVES